MWLYDVACFNLQNIYTAFFSYVNLDATAAADMTDVYVISQAIHTVPMTGKHCKTRIVDTCIRSGAS